MMIPGFRLSRSFLFASVILFSLVSTGLAAPSVVVSIPPIHSLVSAVMQGVGTPGLLIPGGQSPHNSHLKPSAMQGLSRADFVITVSPDFEISLRKPIAQQERAVGLNLVDISGIHLLDTRLSSLWNAGHTHEDPEDGDERHTGHSVDFHLWLSSENARVIVRQVADMLVEIDPENAEKYTDNATQTIEKIGNTAEAISLSLDPVQHVPYLVFHDAYHYFEHEFGLNPAGAVTLSPERTPGARSLLAVRKSIVERNVECIFHEPQFQPRLVTRIADEAAIRVGELDPMGAGLEPGPDLWFELMLNLRDQLLGCLRPS